MNMRALKKEWKKYRKDCKKNKVEFLPLDEFIEKVLSEEGDSSEISSEGESNNEINETLSSLENDNDEEVSDDDLIEIPDIVPVKLITRCTCKEMCACHEIGETCSCKEDCECVKETVNENMPQKLGHQLTFEESENYEEYLDSLPTDVKYSELEPDLWKTIIHTDTFKKAECHDIRTAERQTQEILTTYKDLFAKKNKKTSTKKKSKTTTKKSKPKSNVAKKVVDEEDSIKEVSTKKTPTKTTSKKATAKVDSKKTPVKKASAKKTPAKKASKKKSK